MSAKTPARMNTRTLLAMTFLAVATLTLALPASALSFKQFDSETRTQQADFLVKAVDKIVADVARVKPGLSQTIQTYFSVAPTGQVLPPGMIAFGVDSLEVQKQGLDGKLDLDKVQIEGMLLGIIKRDLMSPGSQNKPPAPKDQLRASATSTRDTWTTLLGATSDQWIKYLDQNERETSLKLQQTTCRVIRLQDGRPVVKGDHGWVAITEQEALEKYRACLAQHPNLP